MQIRHTPKTLLCIRTVYQKSLGRGKATTIASFKRFTPSLEIKNADGFDLLTTDEQKQLVDYMLAKEKLVERATHEWAHEHLIRYLDTAISAAKAGVAVDEEHATQLYTKIDEYQKLLKKQGFKKGELLKKADFELEQEQDGVLDDLLAKVTDSNKHAPI